MSGCPAKEPIAKKFLFWEFRVPADHDYTFCISYLSWWTIEWRCKACGAGHSEWPLGEYEIMKRFNLTKCPSHYGIALYSENDLAEYRTAQHPLRPTGGNVAAETKVDKPASG